MIERLVITLMLVVLGVGITLWFKRRHVRRLNQGAAATAVSPTPTILYFGSDNCAACPTQGIVLDQLTTEWNGRVAIKKIDAEAEPEKAAQFGVFTLPTTILMDAKGSVREINYGLTYAHKLNQQLANL